MVPLDMAMTSYYRLSVVTNDHISVCSALAAVLNAKSLLALMKNTCFELPYLSVDSSVQ